MKIRIVSIAGVTIAAGLLAGCTVYKNSDACEQLMRSKLADTSPDTLKITHTGAGIKGSRVVVEGTIDHVAGASAASGASAPLSASAPLAASTVPASSAALAASAPAGSSAVVSASAAGAPSPKPVRPKKVSTPAAAECTFHGSTLNAFNWLAPASFAAAASNAASATAE